MKYVAGIITGVIGGSLLSVGLYMAYRKHKLIDDLTIVRVQKLTQYKLLSQTNYVVVNPANFSVNIDNKTLVEKVDNPYGVNTFPLKNSSLWDHMDYDMQIEGYGNEYLINFKNSNEAKKIIESLCK
jgi:hypothetical protein